MQVDVRWNTLGKYNMFGDLTTQQWARDALPVIVEHAKRCDIIRYEELRSAIGATTNRKMGMVCGMISTTLYQLEHNQLEHPWQKGRIPRLSNIVIRTNGKPGEWMCEQITGDRQIAPSPEVYKAEYIKPVWRYQNWDEVLETLTSESIDRALAELDEAYKAYHKISHRRSNAETLLKKHQLQKNVFKALNRLNEAEESWAKSVELYCRLVSF